MEITPAVVRLYGRAIEIENELEDEIVDRLPVEELLAWPRRRIDNAKARRLRAHREYRWTRAELVRLLGFDPFKPKRDRRELLLAAELSQAFLHELMRWDEPRLRVVA